ncbi:hypothetical protein CPJ18_25540 (plasmid) [Agrobacterium rosae]|uniref:Uncharacterized protein n=1 Tax=Agrobacterium rosae TaxID=1972867 RepID=A0AAE5VMA4_9HYPH|nr:hypothetical protein CPJ18_25540 [Agrobacterium rosae]POO52025.1 hypothetical protein CTT39_21300 [Agrobacterium rosae]
MKLLTRFKRSAMCLFLIHENQAIKMRFDIESYRRRTTSGFHPLSNRFFEEVTSFRFNSDGP